MNPIDPNDATGDDYPENPGHEISNIVAPTVRQMRCPGCLKMWNVRPIRLSTNWHYRGCCPSCGVTWSNLFKIQTKCPSCGALTFCTPKNKFGVCQACHPQGAKPAKTSKAGDTLRDE